MIMIKAIETSIPSYYYETRTDTRIKAMQEWTKQWWDLPQQDCRLIRIALPVIVELLEVPYPKNENCLKLIENIPVLEYTKKIDEIVTAYIKPLGQFEICIIFTTII